MIALKTPTHNLFAPLMMAAAIACATASAQGATVSYRPEFQPVACTDGQPAGLRCGRVAVPEDWTRPLGRQIALNVVVVPALDGALNEAPLVFLAGGPGSPATEYAASYIAEASAYRANREVVLFDLRGTGGSGALHCPTIEPPRPDMAQAYGNPYAPDDVRRCRDTLSRVASLAWYNTSAAVKDLDAVRQALGHDTINLSGLSYGTTYALAYMHAYPTHVRAAILESVAAPENYSHAMYGLAAHRGLDALLAACEQERTCHARYPDPRGDLSRTLYNLNRSHGFTASAGSPRVQMRFEMTAEQFMEELRGPLSLSPLARGIPKLLHDTAAGDFQSFVDLTLPGKLRPTSFARGLYFSMMCTDAYRHINYAVVSRAARANEFGDYKLRIQRDVCTLWPSMSTPRSDYSPFGSAIPTLFISGTLDPVTPPAWAARVAARFTQGRQIFIPGMGHVPATADEANCITSVEVGFLNHPDPLQVDASCASTLHVQPFD